MTWCGPPSIENLLAEWWGGGSSGCWGAIGAELASLASNLRFGTNPPYAISDFFAFYPKFGTFSQGIASLQPSAGPTGAGYVIGDVIGIVQTGGSGAQLEVVDVDGTGAPIQYQINAQGAGYQLGVGIATSGGTGTGATIDILTLSGFASQIPPSVLQAYINLASASINIGMWIDSWQIAMNLFVAHYATLYLQSEGQPSSSAAQIAQSGLNRGIAASKAAGDVSVSYEIMKDEAWGAWNLTSYGFQLLTMAKVVGMGGMYVR